ncbi:Uu.00g002700.m01.CDS01 [Anthostomella pinea]|uniref:Uu.00g002700.m01.CDS01 n=1 Tax=Anthostomella pinea TaxID=933095 RepID=A0AAI8VJL0_9PEZI|nr:Uu.00g002700.m01.CDS01 [Anthostomella pinea]
MEVTDFLQIKQFISSGGCSNTAVQQCDFHVAYLVTDASSILGLRVYRTAEWSGQGSEYHGSVTHPNIPYTIYVHDNHLLLVPRAVDKLHKELRDFRHNHRRFTLQLSDDWLEAYQKYNMPPIFAARKVNFGFNEDKGVVVAALLGPGSNLIPYWNISSMLRGRKTVICVHFMYGTPDPEGRYQMMLMDLDQAA